MVLGATYTTGDVIGCAYDLDAGTIRWYKNGTIQSTTTGIDTTNSYIPFVKGTTSEESVVNFGQDMTFAGYKTGGADASLPVAQANFSMRSQLDIWRFVLKTFQSRLSILL